MWHCLRVDPAPAPFALPSDPILASVARAHRDAGAWCHIVDERWRLVYMTDDYAAMMHGLMVPGDFMFAPAHVDRISAGDPDKLTMQRITFGHVGGWVLADFGGDRDALRRAMHADLADLIDDLEPSDDEALAFEQPSKDFAGIITIALGQRIRDDAGHVIGTVFTHKPSVDMTTLFMLAGSGDIRHLERMRRLATAARRPAAVLFADLEGSSQLARRLPTASYLTLVRRMTRAADRCVVDAGGLVGRHVGDGVTAFFVAESPETESAAAAACIGAARELQASMAEIANRHELRQDEVVVRAGLHWGATLYIGSIITPGRSEVTALGDEVNEAARIEACATGGRALASKGLIERLDPDDAARLGIDPNRVSYTQLADLDAATDKARRDAPAVPVCDVTVG
jgi:class 3 adenylate cyclase